jgi:hypothetical protein
MLNNFCSWGEKRKLEIMEDPTIQSKLEECNKVDDRISKFRETFSFLAVLENLPVRRKSTD